MYIDFNKKFIFVAVPKTGSRTIHNFFNEYIKDNNDIERIWTKEKYHQPLNEILLEYPVANNYFKFGFVRNPFDRMVSTFLDFTLNKSTHREFAQDFDNLFKTFPEFILNFSNTKWINEIHMQPAVWYLYNGSQKVDYVGKFENLESDFSDACLSLGLKNIPLSSVPKLGVTAREKDYREFYTDPKMIQVVHDFYVDDFNTFGYLF